MKKINIHILRLSFYSWCLLTFIFLGMEPNNTESSMYEYEHFFDKGHQGYYLGIMWVVISVVMVSSFIYYIGGKIYEKQQNKFKPQRF